jgi:hypothetical protein
MTSGNDLPLIKIVNLDINKKERDMIRKIDISNDDIYAAHFYYKNKKNAIMMLQKIISSIGNNNDNLEKIVKIIHKIIKNAIKYQNEESGIIDIRIRLNEEKIQNNPKFRWHRDGYHILFDTKKPVYKFVTTLMGESTPVVIDKETIKKFDDVSIKQHELIGCIDTYFYENNIHPSRAFYDELNKLTAPQLIEAVNNNYYQGKTLEEGVFFLTMSDGTDPNSGSSGAIHSEPEIESKRFFIAVLPGPKDKCKEYVNKVRKNNKHSVYIKSGMYLAK